MIIEIIFGLFNLLYSLLNKVNLLTFSRLTVYPKPGEDGTVMVPFSTITSGSMISSAQ